MSYLNQYDALAPADAFGRIQLVNGWLRTDAHPFFAELRERRPILQTAAFTLVTKYHDVTDILTRDDIFTVRSYAQRIDPTVGPMMLSRDRQPLNWKHKSIMRGMMPMEDIPWVRDMVGGMVDDILKTAAPQGRLEAVNELGRAVPYLICGRYFGFPGPDRASMYRWSKATQTDYFKNVPNEPHIHQAAIDASGEMKAYLTDLIKSRRAELASGVAADRKDTLTRLLQTVFAPGLGFDEAELVTNMCALLVGAIETTSQAIVQTLEQMLKRPQITAAALTAAKAGDNAAFDGFVWEALRFNPINPLLFRVTSVDAVLAAGTCYETQVPANSLVFASTTSAMWDGQEVKNPDAFVPGRPSCHYFHFGYKAHACLGVHVGEVMVAETVRRVLLSPNPHLLDGDEGKIDFQGGPFPERFMMGLGS